MPLCRNRLECNTFKPQNEDCHDPKGYSCFVPIEANKEPVAEVPCSDRVIKPCPFCGGALYLRELDEPNAYFGCKGCDVDIVLSGIYDESEAVKAIDRRAYND